jgi:ABC-type bacteriocin/lantibiotic exporter with double-glycine peptidase domain
LTGANLNVLLETDSRVFVRGFALAVTALLGFACQTSPHLVLSDDASVLDMPVVRQDEMYACGLASVSALCSYWSHPVPSEERDQLARLARDEKGLSGEELCTALEGLGFETFLFQGEMGHGPLGLMTQIDARRPPLIMLSPSAGEHHYVLFMGYDDTRRAACILDPVRGSIVEPYESFEKAWQACDRFTLVAYPDDPSSPQH